MVKKVNILLVFTVGIREFVSLLLFFICFFFKVNLKLISEWYLDTGVTVYICFDRNEFKIYRTVSDQFVYFGDDRFLVLSGRGIIELSVFSGNIFKLVDVYYVSEMIRNLIFVRRLNADNNSYTVFIRTDCRIIDVFDFRKVFVYGFSDYDLFRFYRYSGVAEFYLI